MAPMTRIALYMSIFIALTAVLYDQLTRHIVTRLSVEDAPSRSFGLVRADELSLHPSANGVDIVFVHGLGSNPDTTWRSGNGVSWISDLLPQDIPASFRDDIRLFYYNYDSYWKRDAVQTRLWSLAKSLLDHVLLDIRGSEKERTRHLIFVGHSYGGLVIKQALVQAKLNALFANIAEHTRVVLFLGTPHRGSSFSTLGILAAQVLRPLGSNPSLLREIIYDSPFLWDLHQEFEQSVGDELRIVNFFEQRKTRLLKLWFFQWEEFCVKEQSATYTKVENIGLTVDHYGLNKFGSKNEDYRIVSRKLIEHITKNMLPKHQRHSFVPVSMVESYTDRSRLSAAIIAKLRVHHQMASVPYAIAIHGLSGTGKTQLALKYIQDNRGEYSTILWIDASDDVSVQRSFEQCASVLQLPVDRRQTDGTLLVDSPIVQSVLQWLRDRKESDGRWLVVIDNANEYSWGIKEVLPAGAQGSVIITSQDSQSRKLVDGGCEELPVATLEPLEARALLFWHLHSGLDMMQQDISEDCDKLAQRLGYLALAIDLAGAYLGDDTNQIQAVRQYVVDYDRHQDDLLQSEHFRGLSATDKTVSTLWDATFKRIGERYGQLKPLLLLAFLAHFHNGFVQEELLRLASSSISSVARDMFGEAAEPPEWLNKILASKGEWDDFYYRQSRDVLLRYSLLQRTQEDWVGVKMHGLVRWRATKLEQTKPLQRWHLMTAMAACVQVTTEKENWEFAKDVGLHIPSPSQEHLTQLGIEDAKMPLIWRAIFHLHVYDAQKLDVMQCFLKQESSNTYSMQPTKLWKNEEFLSTEHANMLFSIRGLAFLYQFFQTYGEEDVAKIDSVIFSNSRKDDWQNLSLTLANHAEKLMSEGRWENVKRITIRDFDESDKKDPIISLIEWASALWSQGRVEEAKRKFLAIIETERTRGATYLGRSELDKLASSYRDETRLDESEELQLQIIKLKKEVMGECAGTLTSMGLLAQTFIAQKRWEEARELQTQVVERYTALLGKQHFGTLFHMQQLAHMYFTQGRRKEAEAIFEQVKETSTDEEDLLTALSMADLVSIYAEQKRWVEVEHLLMRLVDIATRNSGWESTTTLLFTQKLAMTFQVQKRLQEAEELQVKVVEGIKIVLGENHAETLESMATLAHIYTDQRRWREAEALFLQVLEGRKAILGMNHIDTRVCMARLVVVHLRQLHLMEAVKLVFALGRSIDSVGDAVRNVANKCWRAIRKR